MMPDREKVIMALECCDAYYNKNDLTGHERCPYNGRNNGEGCNQLYTDALELLKERNTTNICHIVKARIFSCEKCGYGLNDLYLTNEHDYPFDPAYCPNCGRKVIN